MQASPPAELKFNRPIEAKRRFDVSSARLWDMIRAPESLNDHHPFCRTNEVLSWDDDERADRLEYLNGRTYVRRFQSWTPMEGYTLLIGEEGGYQSFVEWTVKAEGEGHSSLTISVHPFLLAGWPKWASALPYRLWIRPRLTRYLKAVLAGYHHVETTGEAVPRNHFGRHGWFS